MEKIVLNQVSNPGISFTKDVNEKILALYDFLNSNNKNCTYQQFQEDLINSQIFTGSYIRSFIPFLYNAGIINDYNNGIAYNDLFTKNGLLYVQIVRNIKNASDSNIDLSKMLVIKSDLLCMSLDYMIKSKYKFYDKYLDILKFIKKYRTINREEFYIMEYCLQNSYNYDDYINAYRNESKQYDIYINSNNDEVLSYRSNNAFNYLIAFLSEEQCNYLKKLNHGDYIINEEREKFIDLVLNSEGDVK